MWEAVRREDRETLLNIIKQRVEKGAALHTDEARQYLTLAEHGFRHEAVNHSRGEYVRRCGSAKSFVDRMATTNGIESVWALLKRGFYGTFHKFSREHLQGYVNEFMFRWNEGNCRYETMQRIDSIAGHCWGKTLTYRQLVGNG